MSVSLLDVLSNGLAVVVILLIIALNSGQGLEEDLELTAFIEITVYGPTAIENDQFYITWKGSRVAAELVMNEYYEDVQSLKMPKDLDSLVAVSIYAPRNLPEIKIGNERYKGAQEMVFAIPPAAKGLTFEADFRSGIAGETYAFKCEITDGESPGKVRADSTRNFYRPAHLKIDYSAGVTISIADGHTNNFNLSLKNSR